MSLRRSDYRSTIAHPPIQKSHFEKNKENEYSIFSLLLTENKLQLRRVQRVGVRQVHAPRPRDHLRERRGADGGGPALPHPLPRARRHAEHQGVLGRRRAAAHRGQA